MSLPAPTPLVFCTNPLEDDLPFKAWADLSLEIDGQPEHNENLLNLAGYLVRQALADQHPERIKHPRDIDSVLYGLRAHVQLHSGGSLDLGERNPDIEVKAHQVTPGLIIGKLLIAANEPGCVGLEELHERLNPVNAAGNLLSKLQASDLPPTSLICALLPGMTITLTPAFSDSQTLTYPSHLEIHQEQLKQAELAGLPQERCEIVLDGECLDDTQPAYGIAYELLSLLLLLLRQRAHESEQPDLSKRQQEWERVRLVIGSDLHYDANYVLDPKTYKPAYGHPVRCLKLSGTQRLMLPANLDLPALEQIWDALVHESMHVEWQRLLASKEIEDQAVMITLEVGCKLEILARDANQQLHVLESYRDNELLPASVEQITEEITTAPVLEPAPDSVQAQPLVTDAAKVEQQVTPAVGERKRPRQSGSYGPLALAAVVVATLAAILIRG
ncbi:hypothetical protein ACI2KX_18440 [Ectopseudomonas khazarica]|uniref:hypothetical protein n=1 Tax=Ectopseudomonas khazarica TaxID=2502979 RepID=UPI00384DED54